jgi:hypothetical protein
VVVAEVTSILEEPGRRDENYDDGSSIWWRWRARTRPISENGFVGWQEVNQILEYSPEYNMSGFGGRTGLKEINEEQFNSLVERFDRGNS